jgi:Domain of unknown function (DUF4397)
MPFRRILPFAAVALIASACNDSPTVVQTPDSSVRVINAGGVPLNILIDGVAVEQAVGVASVSTAISVRSGSHVIGLRASGVATDISVQTTTGQTLTTVAVPSGSGLVASVLVDSGSIVPAGKSKLRVSHLAGGAPAIEFWRTQPDFQTPVHIMTPFAYQATSPYLQSDPGTWEVFVTAPGGGAKLATTGAISVPAGERRTVVLLDSLGVMRFRVIAE